jgi:hypothetical protein
MIPIERIRLRATGDPATTAAEVRRRVSTAEFSEGAHFKSVRYSCTPSGHCVANSFFKIPYLPVLTFRQVGPDVDVLARPSILELLVFVTILVIMVCVGWPPLGVALVALVLHVAGYVCFKLAVGDLRPLLGDLVDDTTRCSIGWA